MKISHLSILTLTAVLFLGACSSKKETATAEAPKTVPVMKGGEKAYALPNATVFQMSGDYAGNVAVTLNADGSLAYYPAPTDITTLSAPVALADGWYLNRQGLGPNSVFTTYTFEEYGNLKETPTHQQLLEAVIPGAVVTAFKELPVSMSAAFSDPSVCNGYLK